MNSGDSGSFNRLKYDRCATENDTFQATQPFQYRMSMDPYENDGKCVYDKDSFYHPYDNQIVDTESELKGIKRPASKCPQNKYSPNCEKSDSCVSTFDNSVPIVYAQEVCPIVRNNIPRVQGPGYELNMNVIGKRNN